MSHVQPIRIGDLLLQEGLLSQAQLMQALQEQKRSGRKLGRLIIDSGWVTEEQVSQALSRQLKLPYRDVSDYTPPFDVISLLPEVQARRLRAVVLEDDDGKLIVGMVEPTDINAFDELGKRLKRSFDINVVTESQLIHLIERGYVQNSNQTQQIDGLAKELTSELIASDDRMDDLLGLGTVSSDDAPVVKLLSSVFEEAMRLRASDIHIEPQETCLRFRFRIDGVLHVKIQADPKITNAVVVRLKLMSGLDISEKRLPQDGRFQVKLGVSKTVDMRISTLPTQYGESVVMRLMSTNAALLDLTRMNLPTRMHDALNRALAKPSGMILVTGPTGSGKTTTLYAALNHLNSPDCKILTVEDPVEYRLPGLNQVQVQEKIDLTFDRVLRAALRQDPDVVLVGEIRDAKTAEIGMRAAMTGHLVLSTLHTNDAVSTPVRLLDMGVPPFMVGMSLQLVLAQRLVRTNCKHCAEPVELSPQELLCLTKEFGDDLGNYTPKRGKGCQHCNNTGFSGRTGVYEFIEMNQTLIDAVLDPDPNVFMRVGREQMMGHTLVHDALNLVLQGRSTVAEAMKVNAG